jgi:hypothetical protein
MAPGQPLEEWDMRRIAFALLLVAAVGVTSGIAQDKGKMKMPEPESVQGTLVDMKCYSMNAENSGQDHMTPKGKMPACATACAKMGIPVGILVEGEDDSKLLVIITPSNMLADHMAKQARITGMPALDGHGIIPDKVEVKEGDKWKEVKIATMM